MKKRGHRRSQSNKFEHISEIEDSIKPKLHIPKFSKTFIFFSIILYGVMIIFASLSYSGKSGLYVKNFFISRGTHHL